MIKIIVKKIFKAIIPHGLFLLLIRIKDKKNIRKKLFQIETHITEHCNLKCRSCLHFSCIAENEYLSTEIFDGDFKRLSQITNKLSVIKLVGGEPLLHPKICEFIKIARKYFPNTLIQITTNGILLDKQSDTFWRICSENNVVISVSTYPINLDVEIIEKIARENRVYLVYDQDWEKIYDKRYIGRQFMCQWNIDVKGKQDYRKSYYNCDYKLGGCVTLREGKIYNCCVAAHIKYFNNHFKKNLETCNFDYVDIYSIKDVDEIYDFLKKPFPFCRYCNPSKIKFVEWDTTKKEISEWT